MDEEKEKLNNVRIVPKGEIIKIPGHSGQPFELAENAYIIIPDGYEE